MTYVFYCLEQFNTFLWGYMGVTILVLGGLYLSFYSKWAQIFKFPQVTRNFIHSVRFDRGDGDSTVRGTSPLKAFFASLGGCIGIGNLVTVALAVQIGGPGALVWIWVAALLGMILKYAEIYLGMKFRIPNSHNSYDGGPMYFLPKAFPKIPWIAPLMAGLLCVYGIEIFMFGVVKDTISSNWDIPQYIATPLLILLILYGISGGVRRIGTISTILIPAFIFVFLCMTIWVLAQNAANIPYMFSEIIDCAFTSHAAAGGVFGGSMMLAMAKGFSAAAYSGDVGIGYASIIQSESRCTNPTKQASLSIFGIFLDTFVVCTCTVLLVLITGVWKEPLEGFELVQAALSLYFPYMHIFMPVFLFVLGYTTLLPYMMAGMKCARFLSPKKGAKLYVVFGVLAFSLFSFVESIYALTVMNIAGGLLMMINLPSMLKLRKEVSFKIREN